jgi:hypothetical protein
MCPLAGIPKKIAFIAPLLPLMVELLIVKILTRQAPEAQICRRGTNLL